MTDVHTLLDPRRLEARRAANRLRFEELEARVPEIRRRERERAGLTEQALYDFATELRIVVAIICDPVAFACTAVLGLPDFHELRCVAVVIAIRALPNHFEDVTYGAVMEQLELSDAEHERCYGERRYVADNVRWWLFEALCDFDQVPPYRGAKVLIEHDVAWLQELARRREQIARCG